jgi:hypothetical protein
VRLLVKNLGKSSVVCEELKSLNIRVQGVMQLRSGRRDQDHAKDRPPPPPSLHRLGGERTRGVQGAIRQRALRSADHGGIVRGT